MGEFLPLFALFRLIDNFYSFLVIYITLDPYYYNFHMNLLTSTQFNQQVFSHPKPYHFHINSWQKLSFKECSGTATIHIHDPVASLTLENCHFDNLVIETQRLIGKIILINCSGNITLSSHRQQTLDIEFQGNNHQLQLSLRKWTVSRQIFEDLIEQHGEQLIFEKCYFNKVKLSNKAIEHLGLHQCEGNLHLKSDTLKNISKLNIKTQHNLWGKKFVFYISGYHVLDCNMETKSFIKETRQKLTFTNSTIESFNIQDSSFFLPYIPPWFNIILFLLTLFINIYPNNISSFLSPILFSGFILFNIFDEVLKKNYWVTKIFSILFCLLWAIYVLYKPNLVSVFHWIILLNNGIFVVANFVFSMFLIAFYTFSMSVSQIGLTMKDNTINKIRFNKSIFNFSENKLIQKIGSFFIVPLDYLFNGRFFKISLIHNKINQFYINNDGFSNEEKIIIFYEQPDVKISGINFLSLGKESFFYKKMLSFYENKFDYLSNNSEHIFTLVTKLIFLLLSLTFTSHFIRLKNLVLSIICTVTLGSVLIFTHDNITIKDNNVQMEILKAKNTKSNLCQPECTIYYNEKDKKETQISVPDFYDKYNPYYFTINELLNLPLLETNKSFKPNNEPTEFFSFIYHCLGLIYTSAFVWHLTKFILFKKAEVEIEEKAED